MKKEKESIKEIKTKTVVEQSEPPEEDRVYMGKEVKTEDVKNGIDAPKANKKISEFFQERDEIAKRLK